MNMIPHLYLILGLMHYCGVYVESAICQGGPLNDKANNNITCHDEQRIQSNPTSESQSVELSLISNDSFFLEPSVVSTASNYLNRTHSEIESSTFLTNVSTLTFDNGKISNSTASSDVVPTVMIGPVDSVILKTDLMLMDSVIDDNSSFTRHTKHMKSIHSPHVHTFRTEKPEINNYLQISSSDKYDQLNINVSEIHTASSLVVPDILFSSVFDSSLDSSVWTMPISSNISTSINSNQTSFMSSTIDFEQQMNLLSSSISSYDTSSTIFDNHDVNHTNDVVRFNRSMLVSNETAKQTSRKENVSSEVTESQPMSSNVSYTSTRTNISTVNARLLTETNTHPQPTETVQDQPRTDYSPASLSVNDSIVSSSTLIIPTKVGLDPNIKTEMVVDFRINELEFGSQIQPISTLTSQLNTISSHLPSSAQEMLSGENTITVTTTSDTLYKARRSEQPYTNKPEPSMRIMPIVPEQPSLNGVPSGGLHEFKEVLTGMKDISFSDNLTTTRIPKVGGSQESSNDRMYVLSNDTITIIVIGSVVGIVALVAAIVIITTFPQTRKRTRKSSTTNDIEMSSKDKDNSNVEKEKENKVSFVPSQTETIQEKPEIETVHACDETSSDSTPNRASTGDSTPNSALTGDSRSNPQSTGDSRSNPQSTGDSRPNIEFTGDSNT